MRPPVEMETQLTQNICITFIQRRTNVEDVGPTLYKCSTNVLWLLGRPQFNEGVGGGIHGNRSRALAVLGESLESTHH